MTKDEALKLALEALELEDLACRYEKDPTPEHIAKAITAIREALAQPEQEPVACIGSLNEFRAMELVNRGFALTDHLYTTPPKTAGLLREIAALSANALDDYKMIQSLMAQRKPLTDEEIDFLWQNTSPYYDHQDFARAIEAAHGIKE